MVSKGPLLFGSRPRIQRFPVPGGRALPFKASPRGPLPARVLPAERSKASPQGSRPLSFHAAPALSHVPSPGSAAGPLPCSHGSRRPRSRSSSTCHPEGLSHSGRSGASKGCRMRSGRGRRRGSVRVGVSHRTRRTLHFLPLSLLFLTRCQFELPAPSTDWED